MQLIISQVHKLLIQKKKTIAVAESCTGGLASALFTETSGSSRYFLGAIVAYNNRIKHSILKIPSKIIRENGAVSEKVAKAMAESIRKLMLSDYGIGITGIAGPTGAVLHKPVGTVFIAVSDKKTTLCRKFFFKGSRANIRYKTALQSLTLLKELILDKNRIKEKQI